MNKNIFMILIAAGTITGILIGSLSYTNAAYASTFQQRQACSEKYLPYNTTQYNICIGGMGSNDTGSRPHLR
ncbi:MAG TPA: hypothetical protein VH796_18090 [Nitrososphaeraceae archaeon]|jgi:hypothetical protein